MNEVAQQQKSQVKITGKTISGKTKHFGLLSSALL